MDLRELAETAQLARLNTGKDELLAALPAFEQMLGFFAAMSGADTDETAWTFSKYRPAGAADGALAGARLVGADHFRGDSGEGAGETAALDEPMLQSAGERDGRFIVIPNVL